MTMECVNHSATSFPFTRLPPELQRLVLEKYYEDAWNIKFYYGNEDYYQWETGPSISPPLSVSQEFYEIMKAAFLSSRSGVLTVVPHPREICDEEFYHGGLHRPKTFDNAISKIVLDGHDHLHEDFWEVCAKRFANLKTIKVCNSIDCEWFDTCASLTFWKTALVGASQLLEFMLGKNDLSLTEAIYERTKEMFEDCQCDISVLGSKAIEISCDGIWYCQGSCSCPQTLCPVLPSHVSVRYSIFAGRAEITERRIRSISPNRYSE